MRNRVRIWTRVSFGLFQACSQLLNATRKSSHSWFLFKFMTTNPQWMLNSSGKSCYTPWFSSLSHVPKRRLHSFSLLLWCPAIPSHPFSHNRWLCLKILWENKSHQKDIPLSPPNKYGSLPTSVPLIDLHLVPGTYKLYLLQNNRARGENIGKSRWDISW